MENLSLEFVQQSLVQKQWSDEALGSQADSALVGVQRKDRSHKPIVCWNCDEVGHIQHLCPKPTSQHKTMSAEEKCDNWTLAHRAI